MQAEPDRVKYDAAHGVVYDTYEYNIRKQRCICVFHFPFFRLPHTVPSKNVCGPRFFLLIGGGRYTPCSVALHCVPKFRLPLPSSGLAAVPVARPIARSRGWSYARFVTDPGPFCGRRRRRHGPPRLLKDALDRDLSHWTVQAWCELEHFWVHRVTLPLLSAHRQADQDDEIWIFCECIVTLNSESAITSEHTESLNHCCLHTITPIKTTKFEFPASVLHRRSESFSRTPRYFDHYCLHTVTMIKTTRIGFPACIIMI